MECIEDSMMWYDWASVGIFYVLGFWKAIELINKVGKWSERIIHGDRFRTTSQIAHKDRE